MTDGDDERTVPDPAAGEDPASGAERPARTTESGEEDEELGLEERLERLDEIVGTLEADDVGLEKALALFEEGVRHVRAAEKALSRAELRVEELLGEGPDAETRPLDEEPE